MHLWKLAYVLGGEIAAVAAGARCRKNSLERRPRLLSRGEAKRLSRLTQSLDALSAGRFALRAPDRILLAGLKQKEARAVLRAAAVRRKHGFIPVHEIDDYVRSGAVAGLNTAIAPILAAGYAAFDLASAQAHEDAAADLASAAAAGHPTADFAATIDMEQFAWNDLFANLQQTEFLTWAMEEGIKSVTPFDYGGYVTGPGFNPSDTMAAQLHDHSAHHAFDHSTHHHW